MISKAASRKRAQKAYPVLLPCERCGSSDNVQRHHADHQKPLDIQFLCQKCHTLADVASGTWGITKRPKRCAVCGKEFKNYTHTRVKTCGRACLSEIIRQANYNRYRREAA